MRVKRTPQKNWGLVNLSSPSSLALPLFQQFLTQNEQLKNELIHFNIIPNVKCMLKKGIKHKVLFSIDES